MGVDELRAMREAGMHIGSHGFDHYWLDALDEDEPGARDRSFAGVSRNAGERRRQLDDRLPVWRLRRDSLLGILREQGLQSWFHD